MAGVWGRLGPGTARQGQLQLAAAEVGLLVWAELVVGVEAGLRGQLAGAA